MKDRGRRSDCPINFALEAFGDKWSLLVVRDILLQGKATYGEFLKSEERIATNILADRLVNLERLGILTKTAHATDKRKDLYLLTQKGRDLLPLLLEIAVWSAKYDPDTAAPKEYIDMIKGDRQGLMNAVLGGMKLEADAASTKRQTK